MILAAPIKALKYSIYVAEQYKNYRGVPDSQYKN